MRAAIIGQPNALALPYEILGDRLNAIHGELEVIAAPGHCDDHIVLYDRREKLLIAGDAFMGSYFATPNPDVDSLKWIDTLERLLSLEIEVLVEGHGHIHTLRTDFPDIPGVVIREDPRFALQQKLEYLRWLREQIDSGKREGLTPAAVEANVFPVGKRTRVGEFLPERTDPAAELGALFALGTGSQLRPHRIASLPHGVRGHVAPNRRKITRFHSSLEISGASE